MSNGILNYRGMRVSRDEGTPKLSSILCWFSIVKNPFWGTKILGVPPVVINFMLVFHCKESILGYPNSREPPCIFVCLCIYTYIYIRIYNV